MSLEFAQKVLDRISDTPLADIKTQWDASCDELTTWVLAVQACYDILGQKAYPQQILAARYLTQGQAVEMATGEGKTLSLLLGAIVNAKTHEHQHLAYPTAYLTSRDYAFAHPVWKKLGIKVGLLSEGLSRVARKEVYSSAVVYSPFSEIAFDYLREQLVIDQKEIMTPKRVAILLDELDAQMLDSATQPFVISRPFEIDNEQLEFMKQLNREIKQWEQTDVEVDHALQTAWPSDQGWDKWGYGFVDSDKIASLYGVLAANFLLKVNKDYLLENGQIILIDPHTGSRLGNRRFSGPTHLALELKHGIKIGQETQEDAHVIAAQIIELYPVRAGCSATLWESRAEFARLNITVKKVPKRTPSKLIIHPDQFFKKDEKRDQALIEKAKAYLDLSRPVFIATTSVKQAEAIAAIAREQKLAFKLLTARNEHEAPTILARAGHAKQLTIATQSAGRGVDIVLDQKAIDSGGLAILSAGHLPGKRADRQLAGRAARGSNPGSMEYLVAPDDIILQLTRSFKAIAQLSILWENSGWTSQIIEKQFSKLQDKIEFQRGSARTQLIKRENTVNRPIGIWLKAQISLMEEEGELLDIVIPGIIEHLTKSWKGPFPEILQTQKELKKFGLVWEPDSEGHADLFDELTNFLTKEWDKRIALFDPLGKTMLRYWLLDGLIEVRRRYRQSLTGLLQQASFDTYAGRKVEHTLAMTTTNLAKELETELVMTLMLIYFSLPIGEVQKAINEVQSIADNLNRSSTV